MNFPFKKKTVSDSYIADSAQGRGSSAEAVGAEQSAPLLCVRDLSKSYGDRTALSSVSFELPKGKIIGLLGPNGSGKSTLIKLIAGLLREDSGSISVSGMSVGEGSKAIVAYLPERNSIPTHFTVGEAIDFYSDFFPDFDREKAENMLSALRVEKRFPIRTLSKGAKEKVQLVLVMSRRARLYLLDEPISGVDPAARDYIINTIVRSYSEDSSILISTHLIADIQQSLDGFIILKDGKVSGIGTPKGLMKARGQTLDEYFREVFRC